MKTMRRLWVLSVAASLLFPPNGAARSPAEALTWVDAIQEKQPDGRTGPVSPWPAVPSTPSADTTYLEPREVRIRPRATQRLWSKTKGDDAGAFALEEPVDLAIDEFRDVLYAVSNKTQEIYALNAATGGIIRVIGGKGADPGRFLEPVGMALDEEGRIYTVDQKKRTVAVFSAAGAFVREFPIEVPAELQTPESPRPFDVAVQAKTGDVYISDRGLKTICVFDAVGTFLRLLGGDGDGMPFWDPGYLAFDREGNVAVVDFSRTTISTYDPASGRRLSSWGERSTKVGGFITIGGFAYDRDGNVFVLDRTATTIQAFLPNGRYQYRLGDERHVEGIGIFVPKALAIDSKNRIFVCEGLVDRIQAFQVLNH